MMKKFLALVLCLSVMTVATACGSKDDSADVPEDQIENSEVTDSTETEETADEETMDEDTAETNDEAAEETSTFTGLVEEKKDFMVIVSTEDKSDSYIFNLAEGVECGAEVGDKVTVTYTGDITVSVADMNLTATEIVAAE